MVRSHDERELREIYSNSPDERTISAPSTDDMQTLADGGVVDLDTALEVIEKEWMFQRDETGILVELEMHSLRRRLNRFYDFVDSFS